MSDSEDLIVTVPPQVAIINDKAGLQIIGMEGQTIDLLADDAFITITPAVIALEAPDINLTAEGAVEVEAGDMSLTTGAMEVEAGDLAISAGAVEAETGLFTVL